MGRQEASFNWPEGIARWQSLEIVLAVPRVISFAAAAAQEAELVHLSGLLPFIDHVTVAATHILLPAHDGEEEDDEKEEKAATHC